MLPLLLNRVVSAVGSFSGRMTIWAREGISGKGTVWGEGQGGLTKLGDDIFTMHLMGDIIIVHSYL